ncbi:Uncharacterised protein [uncultured archaeon]|nr:Uncharacterised protein [uncultured archaeon]
MVCCELYKQKLEAVGYDIEPILKTSTLISILKLQPKNNLGNLFLELGISAFPAG